jgi:hypothetical protein
VPEEGAIYAVARDVTALQPDPSIERLRVERDGLLARIAVLERMLPTEPLA